MGNSKVKIILRSMLVSYILTGILLITLAFLLYKFRLGEKQVTTAVYGIYVLTCLLGGWLAGKGARQRRFFWGMAAGCCYFLLLFAMSCLMQKGLTGNLQQIAAVLGICAGSGMIGGMAS